MNSDLLLKLYNEKNNQVITTLKENANYLSIGINNIVALYDPEIIVINSSVYQKIPEMLTWIKEGLTPNITKSLEIINSPLQSNATLLGATIKSVQEFLNINNLKFFQPNE